MKRTILLIVAGMALVLVLLGAGGFWFLSTQALYQPGMVRRVENLSAPLSPPAQPEQQGAWLVEPGIELAHFFEGNGRAELVVHGGPGVPFAQPMSGLQPLTDSYRFHYYDQRGSGESTRPIDHFDSRNLYQNARALDRTLGIGAQIADIERIRRILGVERLILVGHSWGGLLASLYAAEFPENVAALILVAPANALVMPQPDRGSDLFASVRDHLPAARQVEFDALMEDYMDFSGLYAKSESELVALNESFGEYFAEALGASVPAQGHPGGWMVWAQYVSMGQRHDYRSALQAVKVPVLVIHGGDDLQAVDVAAMYAQALPNAELVVIQGASHFPFEEQPEAFAHVVLPFLQEIQ